MNLDTISETQIESQIIASLTHRPEGSSACPSEVARALAPQQGEGWRGLMTRVREVAARLARQDRIVITRGSTVLSPDDVDGGPIRLRRGKRFDEAPRDAPERR